MIGALSSPQAVSLALQGTFWLFIFIFFSFLSLNVSGVYLSLSFVPLISIFLWPRGANYIWSMSGIVLLGLFQDLVGGGPLGLWALVNCSFFLMADPVNMRTKTGFIGQWGQFAFYIFLASIIALMLGRISLGQWPSISSIAFQVVTSCIVFPFFYGMLYFFTRMVSGAKIEEAV